MLTELRMKSANANQWELTIWLNMIDREIGVHGKIKLNIPTIHFLVLCTTQFG
jgi:hypothetical protein